MPGSRTTPEEKARALALRSAGYSIAAISEKTGLSVRTLGRILKGHEAAPEPVCEELFRRARDSLLEGLSSNERLREAIAASVADDLALSARIREKIALGIEMLALDDADQARNSARALSQLASALKATQAVSRRALGADDNEDITDDLAVLEVRVMTDDEIEEARRPARARSSAACEDEDAKS